MSNQPLHSYELEQKGKDSAMGSSETREVPKSTADKLREMKQLLDEGTITQGDFDKVKMKILNIE